MNAALGHVTRDGSREPQPGGEWCSWTDHICLGRTGGASPCTGGRYHGLGRVRGHTHGSREGDGGTLGSWGEGRRAGTDGQWSNFRVSVTKHGDGRVMGYIRLRCNTEPDGVRSCINRAQSHAENKGGSGTETETDPDTGDTIHPLLLPLHIVHC